MLAYIQKKFADRRERQIQARIYARKSDLDARKTRAEEEATAAQIAFRSAVYDDSLLAIQRERFEALRRAEKRYVRVSAWRGKLETDILRRDEALETNELGLADQTLGIAALVPVPDVDLDALDAETEQMAESQAAVEEITARVQAATTARMKGYGAAAAPENKEFNDEFTKAVASIKGPTKASKGASPSVAAAASSSLAAVPPSERPGGAVPRASPLGGKR